VASTAPISTVMYGKYRCHHGVVCYGCTTNLVDQLAEFAIDALVSCGASPFRTRPSIPSPYVRWWIGWPTGNLRLFVGARDHARLTVAGGQ
jgi:hypothetical protein